MKVTYTRILARKILLAFIAFVILLSITALFVRDSISEKLERISKLSTSIEGDKSQPEKALLLLHEADDDFQQSLVSKSPGENTAYKAELSMAFDKIDTLLKKQSDTTNLTSLQRAKIKYWYNKKLELSDRLYLLKHNFDSLLNVYASLSKTQDENINPAAANFHTTQKEVASNSDTVKKAAQKRGLLKRLKDAIRNKDGSKTGVTEIKQNTNTKVTDITTQKILADNRAAYKKKLQQLQQQNMQQLDTQRQLITMNAYIISELGGIINDIKDINYNMADEFKAMVIKSYQETTALLNKLYLTALVLVLIFAILVIIFIVQLNEAELRLHKEIAHSVAIAQQKMDLLHHMSHEVRNPLTAINGFLYIFGKSEMTAKQAEMLDSIKLSSDMMLRTLNDTLDAAKMENSELKIHSEPFNPDYILRMVIESMAFSAAKKKLTLDYNFAGNKDTMLLGDSFRLKQVMVNLLSNAIKYTHEGGVTVNAQLTGGGSNLQVDVIDTGAGISQEQQASLFSKYYQTNSSKGQIGTGLGLFICKQLIKLQGGKILVKSNTGAGTTFTFFIPYQKIEKNIPVKTDAGDPLTLLSGKSILAVDDNELNLLLLKKLTDKWNVIFHQASNGKEALDIISKNTITVILSDIAMPEMDGNELLAAVKKLEHPLPVIVVSGSADNTNAKTFLDKGFAGVIGKPFVEEDVIKQLIKVIH